MNSQNINFIESVEKRLQLIEADFQNSRYLSLDPIQSNSGRQARWEDAYQLQRTLKKHIKQHDRGLADRTRERLQKTLKRALELARENPLNRANAEPAFYCLKGEYFRTAYPGGERFRLLTLHRQSVFYTEPYQITVSLTPPRHQQEIHGHFLTPELTVSLGASMGFKIFRIKQRNIVQEKSFRVPQFGAALFGINTPHTICNISASSFNFNVTAKYREQVTDRWSLDEGPDESAYTFEGNVCLPSEEKYAGYSVYTYDKGVLYHRLIAINPGAQYVLAACGDDEAGFLLAKGSGVVSGMFLPPQNVEEEDVIYVVPSHTQDCPPAVLRNVSPGMVILVKIDLKEPIMARLEQARKQLHRALVCKVNDVLTMPESGSVAPAAIKAICQKLEAGIPILVIPDPPASGSRSEDMVADLYQQFQSVGYSGPTRNLPNLVGAQLRTMGDGLLRFVLPDPNLDQIPATEFFRLAFPKLRMDEVAVFGSHGDVGEPDHDLLAKIGGFSTDTFDAGSSPMVGLRHLSGFVAGYQSFLWALDQLHIAP